MKIVNLLGNKKESFKTKTHILVENIVSGESRERKCQVNHEQTSGL